MLAVVLLSGKLNVVCLYFFLNIFGHLVLDTYVGHIRWLSPFSEYSFVVYNLPAVHEWWILNFILHPTFVLEVALVGIATVALLDAASSRRRALRATPRASLPRPRAPVPTQESDRHRGW